MVVLRYIGLFFVLGMLSGCESGGSAVGSSSGASRDSSGARAISGQVVDDAGLPVDQATVSAYGVVSQSGPDGKFVLKGISSIPARIVVQADKEGFFPATAGSQAGTSQMPFVIVSLAKKQLLGVVSNGAGGELGTGAIKIKCQPESFAGSSTDTIAVYTSYVDPTPGANTARMPGGDFTAINSGTDTGSMISFGAMQIAVETKAGAPVSIKKPLWTSLAIPASMADSAPDSIPVWTMSGQGVWNPFGMAKKVDGVFSFATSSPGAFNCDKFFRTSKVEGRVCSDTLKNPAPFEPVRIGQVLTATGLDSRYSVVVPTAATLTASSRFGTGSGPGIAGQTLTLDLGCASGGQKQLLGEWIWQERTFPIIKGDTTFHSELTWTFLSDGTLSTLLKYSDEAKSYKSRFLWTYAEPWLQRIRMYPDTSWVSIDNGLSWKIEDVSYGDGLDTVWIEDIRLTFRQREMTMDWHELGIDKPATEISRWSRP
ncbi:MAG: carboxypeptidase regulatory-like domain-containing protein [Fibrobacteres bacterium]|nr:carboxypeptidase regulatory-like domain-containing protein [Fibrobacterota bacterium]